MGSVRFDGEDESQPSTSDGKKYKSSKTLLHDSGALNYASVPRKLRSATKKRGRESFILPLAISRKQRRVSNGVQKLRENVAKKSRLIMKHGQGHITKDEKEAAETLNALADMFSDIAKNNKPVLDAEPPEITSSTIVEAGSSTPPEDVEILKVEEDSRRLNTRVTLEAASHSSLLANSTAQFVKFQSLDDPEQPELEFSKQSATARVSGVQSYLSLYPRPKMSGSDTFQSCERMIAQDQVSASGIQYGKCHYPKEDKYKGLLMSRGLSSTRVLSSGTLESSLGSSANGFPAWSENTYCATQPSIINNFTNDKVYHPQTVLEPKESWKRCSTHVCITHLIKILQKSKTSKELLQKPTLLTTGGGTEQELHASIDNQKKRISGTFGIPPFNGFKHSASEKNLTDVAIPNLSHKGLHPDQQQVSKTSLICSSLKQGLDFFSLAGGGCGSDTSEGFNGAGYSLEAPKQFYMSYQHPQNLPAMHFSLPQNGCSSAFNGCTSAEAAPQVQLPPYLGNTFGSSITGHKLKLQQQKWTAHAEAKHNPGGVAIQRLPDWQNRARDSTSLLNYAQAVFPHLHSAVGSKYQHFSPPQVQLMPPVNSSSTLSNVERHHHRLNPAFERNGAARYSDNIQQMQLLFNQHL